ncbi:DUF4304 domain-containing protein [Paenibacillus oryzisoli]|uniref:DUF4304 domain-containing protein n=1 Tax=Paenibacillus oryzisoli TaxID=1850517 RepID=A0A198AKV4_9BACL|nr:DUF4304 domain-containing protein [Paenibacillus oryzisoli]OAS21558.1 hypothetical protein A8708_16630 [Paenibacillus oryzisoli]
MSENILTSSEINQIYKEIIVDVYEALKPLGFRKKGVLNLVRIDGCMYQKMNFQKHTYSPLMTLNVTFRPLFLKNTEDNTLESSKRLCFFESDLHNWYEIQLNYKETSNKIIKLIIDKVLPYYDGLNTSKLVLEKLSELPSYLHQQLILFSALKEHDSEISSRYLDIILQGLHDHKKDVEGINSDVSGFNNGIKYYSDLKLMVDNKNFAEIDLLLLGYEGEFLKKVKKFF